MVLKLYLIVNYYYNTLFLFFFSFYQRSYFLNFPCFEPLCMRNFFMINRIIFSQNTVSKAFFWHIAVLFLFFITYHQSKASYLLFITIFTHSALIITITLTVLSLICVLCFIYCNIVHSLALLSAQHLSYTLWSWNSFSNWRGECMHYGIACDMITELCHHLLICQNISIACIHKFF